MKKISKRAHVPHVSGGNGYQWDNGAIAFGDPMDVLKKREFMKDYERQANQKAKEYRIHKKEQKAMHLKHESF